MDPETQRLFTIAFVGLLLFFPVFNQVAYTALDALYRADHEAQFSDFIKGWDNIPDDRKLEYWDGRNPPPEHWNDADRHDNPRIRDPQNGNNGGGNGGPDDPDGGNGENGEDEQWVEYVTEVLWEFPRPGFAVGDFDEDSEALPSGDYHWVNITYSYTGFSGQYRFDLYVEGELEWRLQETGPLIMDNQDRRQETLEDIFTSPMQIDFRYEPVLHAPNDFSIVITGTYPEVRTN